VEKHWAHAAVPGAIPGALPILMGHLSAQKDIFNPGGIYLFLILFFWQMPHFWTLALKYKDDYARGGFPTLPVKLGEGLTIHQIILWCLAYIGLAMIAPFFLPVRWIYLIPAIFMSVKLLQELRSFAKRPQNQNWLHFFLWVNFSLLIYLGAAAADLWSIYLPIPHLTR
jgi:protoheme IX farnesyltransferase